MKKSLKVLVFILFLALILPCFKPSSLSANQTFTINFSGVDIKNFLRFMGEILQKGMVIDPAVRGQVTIYSSQKIPISEAERVFYSVLQLYGYTAVQKKNLIHIIPLSEVKQGELEVRVGKDIGELKKLGDRYLTQFIPLEYANSNDLVSLLSPFISKAGQISPEERTNTLIITDSASSISKIITMVNALDKEVPPGKENIHIYRLKHADSEELANTLSSIIQKKQVQRGKKEVAPSIVSARSSNSLVVTASPEEYSDILKVIEKLDVLQQQVLIEALIAEVSMDKTREIGINWYYAEPKEGEMRGLAGLGYYTLEEMEAMATGQMPGLVIGAIKGETFPFNIGAIIRLYGQDSDFHILSAPHILTVDNQEATINISEEIPYTKEVRWSTEATNPIASYDYKEVGIKLTITPHIGEGKEVRLDIDQEVTKLIQIITDPTGIVKAPMTAKRAIKSSVIVNDKQMIVLGGLIRNDKVKTLQKVPFFGDIPLLGYLFRRKVTTDQKTNLLIFLTPYVISSKEEAAKLKEEKEEKMKKLGVDINEIKN